MEQKEILEGNKLIAEFMGRKFFAYKGNHSYDRAFNTYKECEEWIGGKLKDDGYKPEIGWQQECGKYHSSWDWLMPVLDKIDSIPNEVCNQYFWNDDDNQHNDFRIFRVQNITELFSQIANLISWYNQQSKQLKLNTINHGRK